jgi:hypothetical protein
LCFSVSSVSSVVASSSAASKMATDDRNSDSAGGAKRVLSTGIALLHEGELVLPAAGSEAQAERVAADAGADIHYHFPIEIEVRGGGDAVLDVEDIVRIVYERLARRLDEAS